MRNFCVETQTGVDMGEMAERLSRILVVDDNRAQRALLRSCLEQEGYEVVEAAAGSEGIDAFEASLPDCVLLDGCMPDLDGFTVCERLRARPQGADVPILIMTALRDTDTVSGAPTPFFRARS